MRDVTVTLEPGRIVGVTGPSGSGKSTLLRVLLGLDLRSAGEIRFDGATVGDADWPTVRRAAPMVRQDPGAPPTSAMDLLSDAMAWNASAPTGAGADAFRRHLHDLGLDAAHADRPGPELSGGESRRLRTALAAALSPRFLVLDEPSACLDAATSRRLASWLRVRADDGVGVLLASHDEALLARCAHHLIVLYDGVMHAEGAPAEIIPGAVAAAREEGGE